MANFVKWRGAFNDEGSPSISHTIQSTQVGQAFRFGIWGGDGILVGPNDTSCAQINARNTVEGATNNIRWYELVGLRPSHVMIEARHPSNMAVWDYFQLEVKPNVAKVRPPVKGIQYDYHVDTKNIGPDTNASMVLTLKFDAIPLSAAIAVPDANGTNWTAHNWSPGEWAHWLQKFSKVLQKGWSEKFWLSTPASLRELEVPKSGGGKRRVQLHCVLNIQMAKGGGAHHRLKVVKAKAPNGIAFRSDSTKYDDADLNADPPGVTGWAKPFTTAIHEVGHTLGLHHPCESVTPATPYCVASHPDAVEIMGTGNELRPRYATPWQNAAASWFNSSGNNRQLKPSDFTPSTYRIAPADV